MIRSVAIFGDEASLPRMRKLLPPDSACAVVVAGSRARSHEVGKEQARLLGVPLFVQPRGDGGEYERFEAGLRDTAPALLLVNSYSMILGPGLLTLAASGAVNVHGSLLPRYRGANVLNWVLINGESETGVTIHYMDERVDAGDIIAQAEVPIDFSDTALSLRKKLVAAIDTLLGAEFPKILRGNNSRRPQDDALASYVRRRRPEDGRIDWSWPAEKIYNMIRALVHPWPGAFYTDSRGSTVVIDSFVPYEDVVQMKKEHGRGR